MTKIQKCTKKKKRSRKSVIEGYFIISIIIFYDTNLNNVKVFSILLIFSYGRRKTQYSLKRKKNGDVGNGTAKYLTVEHY